MMMFISSCTGLCYLGERLSWGDGERKTAADTADDYEPLPPALCSALLANKVLRENSFLRFPLKFTKDFSEHVSEFGRVGKLLNTRQALVPERNIKLTTAQADSEK